MKYLIFISLIYSSIVSSKIIKPEEDSIYKKSCLSDYYRNPFVLSYFNQNLYSDQAWSFVREVDHYCSCEEKIMEKEIKEKEKDWIAYSFKDKTKMLSERDICALNNFSNENIDIHYRSRFTQWFSPQIFVKIEDYNLAGMKKILSEDKYMNYISCFHDEISKDCSKVKSLSVTYSCIKNEFKIDNFYNNYNKCQHWLYENKQIIDYFDRLKIDKNII